MTEPRLDVFQVLADPSRRSMLELLSRQTMTINSLADNFDMSRPAVSKHVKALHAAGFITITDIGRERHCLLNKKGFDELQQWLRYFDNFWTGKLKKLEVLLQQKEKK